METNALYFGDNLDILRRYVPDESVDLVYLDPPFNSNRDYNVIFRDESGRKSDAQLLAFEDTWHWGRGAESVYSHLTNTSLHRGRVPEAGAAIIGALRQGLGTNRLTAYLVEMTVRLVELHQALQPTGPGRHVHQAGECRSRPLMESGFVGAGSPVNSRFVGVVSVRPRGSIGGPDAHQAA